MPGKEAKIVVTERQQELLRTLSRSRQCPQGLAQRAEVILLGFEGWNNEDIADTLKCERHIVGVWRRRWAPAFNQLALIECAEGPAGLRTAVNELLSDRPRPGCPGKFTAEQVTQILALACEPPEKSGRPVTHWTPTELADEAKKRQNVPSISARQVGRFLKEGGTPTASQPVLAQCQA